MGFMKAIFDDPKPGSMQEQFRRQLLDPNERLQMMDESGVDMDLLSLTIPGVQMFDSDTANVATPPMSGRRCSSHPNRYWTGCFAPHR